MINFYAHDYDNENFCKTIMEIFRTSYSSPLHTKRSSPKLIQPKHSNIYVDEATKFAD